MRIFMRILVCGGRNAGDYEIPKFIETLDKYPITAIIAGEAKGFDQMAKSYALSKEIRYEGYSADWDKYGKAAGPIRNKQMLDEGKPDLVIAFPGGKGTANMKEQARIAGIEVLDVF